MKQPFRAVVRPHTLVVLTRILNTAEPDCRRTIVTRSHQQQLAVLVIAVCLREIPDRTLRLVVAAAAEDCGTRVVILEFVGHLPDVADKVHDSEGAGAGGMGGYFVGSGNRAPGLR